MGAKPPHKSGPHGKRPQGKPGADDKKHGSGMGQQVKQALKSWKAGGNAAAPSMSGAAAQRSGHQQNGQGGKHALNQQQRQQQDQQHRAQHQNPKQSASAGRNAKPTPTPAGQAKHSSKKAARSDADEDDLSLEDVLAFGGTKEDFEMLRAMDEGADELVEFDAKGSAKGGLDKELQAMIGKLGLAKMASAAAMDASDEEDEFEEVESGSDADDGEEEAEGEVQEGQSSEMEEEEVSEGEIESDYSGSADEEEQEVEEPAAAAAAPTAGKGTKAAAASEKGRKDDAEQEHTVSSIPAHLPAHMRAKYSKSPKPRPGMLIPPESDWAVVPLATLAVDGTLPDFAGADVDLVRSYATQLLTGDAEKFAKQQGKSNPGDVKWMRTVAQSGTLSDKIAAANVMLTTSPAHQLSSLKMLVSMAMSKGKREAVMAADTLMELFKGKLLPSTRKLKFLHQQPLTHPSVSDKHLALWYFEDEVKRQYMAFIGGLETLSHDTVLAVKNKAIKAFAELLIAKPEQEKNLLGMLVNKMGDNEKKLASKVVYLLSNVVDTHPNMKMPVARELQQLIFRPNIKPRAQYYGVCFLNQLVLTQRDTRLANFLIDIYFALFDLLTKACDVATKMLSALLTGINRAFPFADVNDEIYDEHLNTLFRVVHMGTFSTRIQALMLLFQVMHTRQSVTDRYYRALYGILQDAHTQPSIKQAAFLNIMYKSLSVDPSTNRIKAFVKRLLQLCTGQQPPFVCGALYLVSELAKAKPALFSMVTQPEDDDEERFVDADDSEEGEGKQQADGKSREDESGGGNGQGWNTSFGRYDPLKREPLHSGAELSCAWELTQLASHYHPSVAKFASTLLCAQHITYAGDPLQDFTLMRFLDKFVYKNPKKRPALRGASHMQRATSVDVSTPVNTEAFLEMPKELVAPEDLFFHQYFAERAKAAAVRRKAKKEGGDADEEDFDVTGDADKFDEEEFARAMLAEDGEDFSDEDEMPEDMSDEEAQEGEEEEESGGEFRYEDLAEGEDSDEGEDDGMENVDWDAVAMAPSDEDEEGSDSDGMGGIKRAWAASDDSDEEELDSANKSKSKPAKKKKKDSMPTFASAEDFAHLLEESATMDHPKQLAWQESKSRGGGGRKKHAGPGQRHGKAKQGGKPSKVARHTGGKGKGRR